MATPDKTKIIDPISKILYIDMDNVLVNFPSAFQHFSDEILQKYDDKRDEIPTIFSKMEPMEGAIEAFHYLAQKFDTYILSTAPWENPSAWSDKLLWIKKYIGNPDYKRVILSHNKNLNYGDYLIEDRPNNGAKNFPGELILFGSEKFYNWAKVVDYLESKA